MPEYSSHTFIKGMNKDIDFSLLDKASYIHAENFRLSTEQGKTEGSLENIKGNISFIDGSGTALEDNLDVKYIVGYTNIRDNTYIFCTDNLTTSTNNIDYIYKLNILEDGTYENFTTIYSGQLHLSLTNHVKVIGRYESDTIQKLYWVDGYNPFRFINVADPNVSLLNINQLNILPNVDFDKPEVTKMIAGTLTAGVVQYAYQFFNVNGSESAISPTSGLYPLTNSSYYESDTENFRGSAIDDDVNAGTIVEFTTDSNYDKVRLIALFYDTLNTIPTIRIVTEENTIASGNIKIADTGQSIGELTLEEFRILSTTVFSAKEIATKNNRLFVGNIVEDSFDVDYDTRAYRFNSTGTARIYESNLTSYLDVTTGNWSTVDDEHDAINFYNNPDYQKNTSYQYKYTSGGTELGGEGPNVKFTFSNRVIRLDTNYDSIYNRVNKDDPSYTCYAGFDIAADDVGYQDDEVYRFAAVFRDSKGLKSEPKWIADIAFPSRSEDPNYTICLYESGFTRSTADALVVQFNFRNLPSTIESIEIVRAKREKQDRRIMAQGLISGTYQTTIDTIDYYTPGVVPGYKGGSTGRYAQTLNFISPEISFGNDLESDTSAWFEAVQILNRTKTFDETLFPYNTDLNDGLILKYIEAEALTNSEYGERTNLEFFKIVDSEGTNWNSNDGNISLEVTTIPYIHYGYSNSGVSGSGGRSGRCAVCRVDNAFTDYVTEITGTYDTYLANYKRNIFQGQYGGITYENRQNTEYISTGVVITNGDYGFSYTSTYNVLPIRTMGGDTYIGMFDYLFTIYDVDQNQTDNTKCYMSVVYFPVSSSINLEFRHDEGFKTNTNRSGQYLVQEEAGVYQTSTGKIFTFDKDYYLYNTVYSQQNTANTFIPVVYETSDNADVRVLYSDEKINGEVTDSWTKFRTNAFLDVDSTYGALQNLEVFRNELLFWQDKAFGVLSVNPRSLLQDNNVGQLVLGTGDVLDRYDYISTTSGNLSRNGIIHSPNAVYWYDNYNAAIYKYDGQLAPINKIAGMSSYFNNELLLSDRMIGVYDHKYNELLFSFMDNETTYNSYTKTTLLYSENYNVFESFIDTSPSRYIKFPNNYYIGLKRNGTSWDTYIYNFGLYHLMDNAFIDSQIILVDNDKWPLIKAYDDIYFTSRSANYSTYEYGEDDYNDTFLYFQAWNDYQNTDTWQFIFQGSKNNSLKRLPLDRRERSWTFSIPRDAVTGSSMYTSLDTTKLFAPRIISNYLITKFIYNNTSTRKFNVSNIIFNYRVSKR